MEPDVIGKLDQFITIERRDRTADGMGGHTEAWVAWAEVWANAKAKGGRESLDEGRTNAVFVVVFTIHNLPELNEENRAKWNGEAYNIRGILREGGRPIYMKFEAERGVAS
jgi:SPP1 family predicted phage head-tail adaptor